MPAVLGVLGMLLDGLGLDSRGTDDDLPGGDTLATVLAAENQGAVLQDGAGDDDPSLAGRDGGNGGPEPDSGIPGSEATPASGAGTDPVVITDLRVAEVQGTSAATGLTEGGVFPVNEALE